MKYAAILLSLLFAMTTTPLSATTAQETDVPEYLDIVGTVVEVTEEGILVDTETHGQVLAHLTEETLFEGEDAIPGAYVHILTNGMMTMSLPAQVTALRVGCYAFAGTVTEIDEEFFMLAANGSEYRVNAEAEKLAALTVGQAVTVYSNGMMTMSLPPQIYGEMIVPAE